jgi:hypothetical protein
MASILSRPINSGSKWYYNAANWFGRNFGIFTHGLIDMYGLDKVSKVYQYSGRESGITTNDEGSVIRRYTVQYSGLDDILTEQAVKNVLATGDFDKENYEVFNNDCNDFTDTVFKEYKSLWIEDQINKHKDDATFDVNKAWDEHYKIISADRGKVIDFTPGRTTGGSDEGKK